MLIDFDEARSLGLLLSNSQIYRNQGKPGFPRIVHPSENRVALVRQEVLDYLAARIAARDAKADQPKPEFPRNRVLRENPELRLPKLKRKKRSA